MRIHTHSRKLTTNNCMVTDTSSRVCVLGTKSCENPYHHKHASEPAENLTVNQTRLVQSMAVPSGIPASEPAPASAPSCCDALTWIDVLREWFGGDRYARDYEYLNANYRTQAEQVALYLRAAVPCGDCADDESMAASCNMCPRLAYDPVKAPGHTDMMVDPETLDAFMEANPLPSEPASFQSRVQPWMMACFGEMISGDREERNHRFLEEALELVQACGCRRNEAHELVNYVYGRPIGEPHQEVGGVMVTLAALCLANGLDMHANGETELARVWTKVEQIRAKQASKPKHSPLPVVQKAGEPFTRERAAQVAANMKDEHPEDGWASGYNAALDEFIRTMETGEP